jgi:hypothetical protein
MSGERRDRWRRLLTQIRGNAPQRMPASWATGRIEHAVMQLDWPTLPDQLRLVLHRECDSPEQLRLRASLLMHDSVFGRYFAAAT